MFYPTPHFVPEGIYSSLRDFIVLVFNIKIKSLKINKKKLSFFEKNSYFWVSML